MSKRSTRLCSKPDLASSVESKNPTPSPSDLLPPKPTSGSESTELTPEEIMLASFDSLLTGVDSEDFDERSGVQAAVKLLNSIEDKSMPERTKERLRLMEKKAFNVVTHISRWGSVAAARNIANSYLLQKLKFDAPDAWPPDTTETKWQKDYENAVSAAQV